MRTLILKYGFGFRLGRGSRVGFGTILDVSSFSMGENSIVGPFNIFKGPFSVTIGNGCRITSLNQFHCGAWTLGKNFQSYRRQITISDDVLITSGHFFDVSDSIFIGRGSWIAGRGSQFWTHGLGVKQRSVDIGAGTYVGSAVRFAPGAGVGDQCIVSLGSVVTKDFRAESAVLIAGVSAKVRRSIRDDLEKGVLGFKRAW